MRALVLSTLVFSFLAGCTDDPAKVMHCDLIDRLSICYEYSSSSAWRDGSMCKDSQGLHVDGSCPTDQLVGRCIDEKKAPPGTLGATWVAEAAFKHLEMVPTYYARGAVHHTQETAAKDCKSMLGGVLH